MPTTDQNTVNPNNLYGWMPEGTNQQVQDSLQQLENKQDPLQEVTQAVQEEQSKPQEEFIDKIRKLREAANEKSRENQIHPEIVEGEKENNLELLWETVKLHEDELRERRIQVEELTTRIEDLEKEIQVQQEEKIQPEGETDQQVDTNLSSDNYWVGDEGEIIPNTDEVTVIDELKQDPDVSQWEYEYPKQRKGEEDVEPEYTEDSTGLKQPYTLDGEGNIENLNETDSTQGDVVPPVIETPEEKVMPDVVEPEQVIPEEESKEEETLLNERTKKKIKALAEVLAKETEINRDLLILSCLVVMKATDENQITDDIGNAVKEAMKIFVKPETNLSEQ